MRHTHKYILYIDNLITRLLIDNVFANKKREQIAAIRHHIIVMLVYTRKLILAKSFDIVFT